jgi:hypothetical protein
MRRFTETQKWEDPWFRKLPPKLKLLWVWLLDRCDNAGVIEPDIDLASFQTGCQYSIDILSQFGDRVTLLPCGKFFIPKFISFQYGTLSRACKAHNPVFASLEKHGLKGYPYPMDRVQEKEKEKVQEKEEYKETETEKETPKNEIDDDDHYARFLRNDAKLQAEIREAEGQPPTAEEIAELEDVL